MPSVGIRPDRGTAHRPGMRDAWGTKNVRRSERISSLTTLTLGEPLDPVILGAVAALLGATLGTAMQVHIVHRQRAWSQVEKIRSTVHKLGAQCQAYSTTLYQRANDAQEYKQWAGVTEHLAMLNKHLTEAYQTTLDSCFDLMACGEPRISERAESLHHAVISLQNTWVPRITSQAPLDLKALDADRKSAIEDLNILLNMVEPRFWERIWLFRSPKTARRMLVKLRAERGIGQKPESTDSQLSADSVSPTP